MTERKSLPIGCDQDKRYVSDLTTKSELRPPAASDEVESIAEENFKRQFKEKFREISNSYACHEFAEDTFQTTGMEWLGWTFGQLVSNGNTEPPVSAVFMGAIQAINQRYDDLGSASVTRNSLTRLADQVMNVYAFADRRDKKLTGDFGVIKIS